MDLHLKGKIALVTGASSGIGRESARTLAAEGAKLVLVARTLTRLQAVADEIARDFGVETEVFSCDLTEVDAPERAVATALARFARIDVAVCSAGASGNGIFWEIPDAVWESSFRLKFMGTVRTMRALLAPMRAQKAGRIVVIAGNLGRQPLPRGLPSAFVNAALLAVVKGAADEVAAEGVFINAVSPGLTRTPRFEERVAAQVQSTGKSAEQIEQQMTLAVPSGRVSEVDEVARTVAWLASSAAGHITGTNVTIDGGHTKGVT
ncbi:MAG: SDR family oxidoreductase [Proteobacteria bacterium]|nr:SDR family oxidoreductase [Burkholderiales bacterium]